MQGKQLKKFVSLRTSAFSEAIKNHIEEELKQKKEANVTGIIIDLMKQGLKKPSETGETLSLPTGAIIECPLRITSVPICSWCNSCENVAFMKAKIDSSVCKTCPNYPCETWETILSDKRLSDQDAIKKTPLQQKIETFHSLT